MLFLECASAIKSTNEPQQNLQCDFKASKLFLNKLQRYLLKGCIHTGLDNFKSKNVPINYQRYGGNTLRKFLQIL